MPQYQLDKPDNLIDLWEESVGRFAERKLFGTKNREGVYEWLTYRQVATRVDYLRAGLAQLGVGRGDAVGIIANNRVEWALAAFATYGRLAQFVPMYEAELVLTWKYIIQDSGLKVLFVSRPDIYEKIKDFPNEIPSLKHIVVIEEIHQSAGSPEFQSMADVEKMGASQPIPSECPSPDDIAGLLYTSGTTGSPKGVLLTHGNFTSNVLAAVKAFPELSRIELVTLAILPWAHSYGQTGELYGVIRLGGAIGLAESPATIVHDILLVKPTWLIAVPRIFNRVYSGVWAKMNREGGIAKALFVMGIEAAKRKRELAAKGRAELLTNLKFKLADKIVFKQIRERLGGRLTGSLSASAVMSPEIAQFFFDIGIPIYDCYGLTEASPAVTINASDNHRLGSVGRAIDKVRIVIDKSTVEEGAEDGEVIVYGPNVMKGYHNKPEETLKVLTPDGGLRTGDRGCLDQDGFLYITGRLKEHYKLENGKYCFPAPLEEAICLTPFAQQAVVYGEARPYNICIVVPDFALLQNYAREKGLPTDIPMLVAREDIVEMIGQDIMKALSGKFGGYEIPRKFIVLSEPFTVEDGTLTQTMKVKRSVILERFKDRVEALYASPKSA